jgi:hypothetical protein
MDEAGLHRYLSALGGLELFKNVGEVISIFDTDGNGTLEEEEIKVTSQCSFNHKGASHF